MIQHEHAELLAGWVVEGLDLEVITEMANRAYFYGELPGVPATVVPDDRGSVVLKTRRYSKDEVQELLETDPVKQLVEEVRAAHEEMLYQLKADAEAEEAERQALLAQQEHEREVVPDLAARVEKLEAILRQSGHDI